MKQLDRQSLVADRGTVRRLIGQLDIADVFGQVSLASRLAEIEAQLAALEAAPEGPAGSVALMFGGEPVFGSRAINAEFATQALGAFQELVTRRVAANELGLLGGRGPLPLHGSASLAITDIIRGSVGFYLEEATSNFPLVDTVVKTAIDEVTRIIISAGAEDAVGFEEEIGDVDHRLLLSLKEFFKALDDRQATVRIVEDNRDASLDRNAVKRARERVDLTEIEEQVSDAVVGELLGVLPESRRFEMRLAVTGEIIKGVVAPEVARKYLELAESDAGVAGRNWRVKMRIREVRERNKPPRQLYKLLGLLELA